MAQQQPSRRDFFRKTAAASAGLSLSASLLKASDKLASPGSTVPPKPTEWRNKQEGMSYRRLGRTGMMVSELVIGSFPFDDPKHFPILDDQIERGMNYLDCAAAYSKGGVESAMGQYLKQSRNRDRVFLSTKLSSYYGYIDRVLKEIDSGLPQEKRSALEKRAEQMMADRGVLKPGYHMNYFQAQESQFGKTYYRYLLLQEYGYKTVWRKQIKEHARKLLEASLTRLQTDHLDVLHCPHGVAMPEMLEDDILRELFDEFKKEGLTRAAAVSFHNDVAANLSKVIEVGYYDVAMFAYNIANHAALETLMHKGKEAGLGMIAMKVARLFAMENQPKWRNEKLDTTIPQNLSIFAKAYLWALQNPNLSCCVSQMESLAEVADNAQIVGRQVETLPV